MDRSIKFQLLSVTRQKNAFGAYEETTTSRDVFGQIGSVSATEFFAGGQTGFQPEYRVTMFGPDYQGEKACLIDGTEYSIYRAYYTRTDTVELYLEKRTGDEN